MVCSGLPGGTFRENLMGAGQSRLRDDHYGHTIVYGNGKETMEPVVKDEKTEKTDVKTNDEVKVTVNGDKVNGTAIVKEVPVEAK